MEKFESKKVSIIVPIYNVVSYVEKTINSILKQTYKNLEIILVDDGSTDGSSDICDRFASMDDRIIVIHKLNGGVVSARKAGLEVATGEFIGFVDGDDWIEPDMYEYMVNVLLETDADIVDSGHNYEKDNTILARHQLLPGAYVLDDDVKHKFYQALLLQSKDSLVIFPVVWSKLFRSHIIRNAHQYVPEHFYLGEDAINLIYCINIAKKICQIDKEFYHYVYRETSVMNQKSNKFIIDNMAVWSYCLELIKDFDIYADKMEQENFLKNLLINSWNYLYGDIEGKIPYYKFPKLEILLGKKVILYGAGIVGNDYYLQLSKYSDCKIVGWVDKNYKNYKNPYRKVESLDILSKKEYDYILIAILKQEVVDEIKKDLQKYGISNEKILWYKPDTIGEIVSKTI